MSGEKIARVDLNAEAQRELNQILENNRQHARTLATLSNLLGRLRSLQEDVERYLNSPAISEGFRQRLESFRALAAEFVAQSGQLRQRLDDLEKLRQRTSDPIAARNEANQLNNEIKRLTQSLERLAAEVEEQSRNMEESISAERQSEAYRARQEDRRLRQELSGLLEELKMRLHPATHLSLSGVAQQANALVKSIEELFKSQGHIAESQVRECRARLDALSREVEDRERERQKQRAIFGRLDKAFQGAGFERDDVKMPQQHGVPIKARHVIDNEELRAVVKTSVYQGGKVNLEMWGPSGEDAVALGKDQHCDLNLERVVAQALNCGLVVKSVVMKDPDSPDGWSALEIPGVEGGKREVQEDPAPEPPPVKKVKQQQMMKADR